MNLLCSKFYAPTRNKPLLMLFILAAFSLLQGCGGEAKKNLEDAQAKNQALQAQLDQAEADRDQAAQDRDQLDADLQQANADLAQAQNDLAAEQAAADAQANQAQADLAAANARADQAQTALARAQANALAQAAQAARAQALAQANAKAQADLAVAQALAGAQNIHAAKTTLLQSTIDQLQLDKAGLAQALATDRNNHAAQATQMQSDLDQARARATQTQAAFDQAQAQNALLQTKLAQAQDEARQASQARLNAEANATRLASEALDQNARLAQKEAKIVRLKTERDEALTQLDAAQNSRDALQDRYTQELSKQEAENSRLNAELLQKDAKLHQAAQENLAMSQNLAAKEALLSSANENLAKAKTAAQDLTKKLGEAVQERSKTQKDLESIDALLKTARAKIAQLESDVADKIQIQGALEQAKKRVLELESTVAQFKTNLDGKASELSEVKRLSAVRLAQLQASLSNAQKEIALLKATLADREDYLNIQAQEHARLEGELKETRHRAERNEALLAQANLEFEELKRSFDKQTSDLEEQRHELLREKEAEIQNLRDVMVKKSAQHLARNRADMTGLDKKERQEVYRKEAEKAALIIGGTNKKTLIHNLQDYYGGIFKPRNDSHNIEAKANLLNLMRTMLREKMEREAFCIQELGQLVGEMKPAEFSTLFFAHDGWVFSGSDLFAPRAACTTGWLEVCMEFMQPTSSNNYLHHLQAIAEQPYQDELENLVQVLKKEHKDQEGSVWGVDTLPLNTATIVATPQYLNAERSHPLHEDHSIDLLSQWGATIASAEHYVDITTLAYPSKTFELELIKSLKILKGKNKVIQVRILIGANNIYCQTELDEGGKRVNLKQKLEYLIQEVNKSDSPLEELTPLLLKISLGTYDVFNGGEYWVSWNHSKIVAADGNKIFTGGHNLYSNYLDANPTHDLSVGVSGKIAQIGHNFANLLWKHTQTLHENRGIFLLKRRKVKADVCSYQGQDGVTCNKPTDFLEEFSFEKHGIQLPENLGATEPVIAIGRLGDAKEVSVAGGVSDTAMLEMIGKAKRAVFISQQAIFPIVAKPVIGSKHKAAFTRTIMRLIAQKINEGVDFYILTSGTDVTYVGKGNLGLSSGYTPHMAYLYLLKELTKVVELETYPANIKKVKMDGFYQKLLKHFHILPTQNATNEVPNHAKLVLVDGKISYVGSHNLYDDSHAEFGMIFGEFTSRKILAEYFTPLWLAALKFPTHYFKDTTYHDYNIGDWVYVKRNSGNQNPNQKWTLGRIFEFGKDPHTFNVDVNPLNSTIHDGRRIPVATKLSEVKSLRLIPIADDTDLEFLARTPELERKPLTRNNDGEELLLRTIIGRPDSFSDFEEMEEIGNNK